MSTNPPDKRRRILDSAVIVFAQHGFYNAKVAQIAKAAGVADGTIYLYFKNKEDILIQVFIDTMDEILGRQKKALASIPEPKDPVQRLRTFIQVHFTAVAKSRALAEVLTVELRQSTKFMRNTDMRSFGRYLSMIATIISDGVNQGVFRPESSPRLTARAIFGVLDELSLEWAMSNRHSSLDEASQHVAELFLSGLVRC